MPVTLVPEKKVTAFNEQNGDVCCQERWLGGGGPSRTRWEDSGIAAFDYSSHVWCDLSMVTKGNKRTKL